MILQVPKKRLSSSPFIQLRWAQGVKTAPLQVGVYSLQLPICKAHFWGCPSRGVGWEGNWSKDPLEHHILTRMLVHMFQITLHVGSMVLPYMDPIGVYMQNMEFCICEYLTLEEDKGRLFC